LEKILQIRDPRDLQVRDYKNLPIGQTFYGINFLRECHGRPSYGREPAKDIKQAKKEAMELLDLTNLSKKQDVVASKLSLIDRKRLEIARL